MKILELCLSPALGGLELYMFRTTCALFDSDAVTSLLHPNGKLEVLFRKNKLPFDSVSCLFRSFPLFSAKRLSKYIDQKEIDVIHVHWGQDLALAAFAKFFSKKKPRLIYTRQMKMTRSKEDRYHQFLYKQMDLMLTITDKLSTEAKRFLGDRHQHKIKRLYYGVEQPSRRLSVDARRKLRVSLGFDDETFLVGLFGRIEPGKSQHLLVEALEIGNTEGKKLSGLIVGHAMDEHYLTGLKQRVKQNKMESQLIFKDFVDQPQAWMQACDCVVLATQEETFGLVLVEAMRVGVPILGTNRGGVPEIIEDGATGLMFEPDESRGLYAGLLRLREDADLCQKFSKAGEKKAAELFSPEKHIQALRAYMKG